MINKGKVTLKYYFYLFTIFIL